METYRYGKMGWLESRRIKTKATKWRKVEVNWRKDVSDVVLQNWKCPRNQNGNVITPDSNLSPGLFHAISSNTEECKIDRSENYYRNIMSAISIIIVVAMATATVAMILNLLIFNLRRLVWQKAKLEAIV